MLVGGEYSVVMYNAAALGWAPANATFPEISNAITTIHLPILHLCSTPVHNSSKPDAGATVMPHPAFTVWRSNHKTSFTYTNSYIRGAASAAPGDKY
jgi:hypothetical protein